MSKDLYPGAQTFIHATYNMLWFGVGFLQPNECCASSLCSDQIRGDRVKLLSRVTPMLGGGKEGVAHFEPGRNILVEVSKNISH